MPSSLGEEAERKIIEQGGMSVDSYRERIETIEQTNLDRENFRNFSGFFFPGPARTEDAKAIKIKEMIESEEKKAEERKAGTNKYIRWMTVLDDRCAVRRSVEVEVDEGTNANFLTRGMATDRGFQVRSLGSNPFQGETVNADITCEEFVELTLVGKEQQQIKAIFYVLQPNDPPNDPRITKPLVGRRLLQESGDLLLTEDPKEPIWSTKMGKETAYMKEQSKQQAANVQTYQANSSQGRDAARTHQGGKDQNQQNKGSLSGTQNEQGK